MNKLQEDGAVMSAGAGGFSTAASATGPVAGFDPIMKLRSQVKKSVKTSAMLRRAKPPGQPGKGLLGDNY